MKSLMVVGTTSHAGKSFLTAAICRILAQQGWHVTPFKGQNMALNAYVTNTGGEIGYAQAVQAWAANVNPRVEMNPILLKPQGNMTSQVILKGKAVGITTAANYYQDYFNIGWKAITESIDNLSMEYDFLVAEGAGSPAEINLKHRDLTNMRVARHLNAPTLLVVDIDRGGAFAHVVGTLQLLEPEERALVKGIVINKFRGQRSLLDSGIEWLENYTKIPVLGVIPWQDQIFPAEDSLSLLERPSRKKNAELNITVIWLPRISNFTDFDALEAEKSVSVTYLPLDQDLGYPDAVIIPGSKTTVNDLAALHQSGMAEQIKAYVGAGGVVLGICGGFQMLGQTVQDPQKLEGMIFEQPGLQLLPLATQIVKDKIARQRQVMSLYLQSGLPVSGYEIHQGYTKLLSSSEDAYSVLFDDPTLGMVAKSELVWGCYLHGLFDNGAWRRTWLNYLRQRRGLPTLPTGIANYREQREANLDAIANLVNDTVDLTPLLKED
ncbi:MAG: cobyric acid synthase CobQ [Microcystaceae cyanobacterium]